MKGGPRVCLRLRASLIKLDELHYRAVVMLLLDLSETAIQYEWGTLCALNLAQEMAAV